MTSQVRFAKPLGGTIQSVVQRIPQSFHRIECADIKSASDERFQFFLDRVLPQYSTEAHSSVLIVIPSYFDFVRLRNHFRAQELSFSQICEYTPAASVSRARSWLFHGRTLAFTPVAHCCPHAFFARDVCSPCTLGPRGVSRYH